MPLEAIIDYPCKVKRDLGQGDLRAGTPKLLELLAVQRRVEQIRATTRTDYLSAELEVKFHRQTPSGPREEATTFGRLELEMSTLDPHIPVCTNCPVNVTRMPFGCIVTVNYPIKKAAERWLLDRAELPTTIGGALLLECLLAANTDGETTRGHRAENHLEAFPGLDRELPKNAYDKPEITGDEVWHLLLAEQSKWLPWQCLNILLWFGAVKIDDAIPKTSEEALKLTRLEPTERVKRAKLSLGEVEKQPSTVELQTFLKALYVGWVRDIEVLVDS